MNMPVSLSEFILEQQRKFPQAKGDFTLLLIQLEYAGKIIASHIRKAGLSDILGSTGMQNASLDDVIKLDAYSNELFINTLTASGQVHAIASEELDEIHYVEKNGGEYVVFLDPLDGSANTETNITVGTIFSIYHKDNLLKPGLEQVSSGYILYGPSVMFVYTDGNGVHGFTLDPSVGSFLLSHPDMQIPKKGNIYSVNEGNYQYFDARTKKFIDFMKQRGTYKARYTGSMVADVHRTLLKGGIFLYPADAKQKQGKLRLLFEINPLAFLIKQAGGITVADNVDPLSITPTSLHQRSPVALGSKENIEEYLSFLK
jgi:fructose-1,6-bisphosphatase I